MSCEKREKAMCKILIYDEWFEEWITTEVKELDDDGVNFYCSHGFVVQYI